MDYKLLWEEEREKDVRRAFGIRAVPRHQISDPCFYDAIVAVRSTHTLQDINL